MYAGYSTPTATAPQPPPHRRSFGSLRSPDAARSGLTTAFRRGFGQVKTSLALSESRAKRRYDGVTALIDRESFYIIGVRETNTDSCHTTPVTKGFIEPISVQTARHRCWHTQAGISSVEQVRVSPPFWG